MTAFRTDYSDMAAFHGGAFPVGVALARQALAFSQELLFPYEGAFVRGKCRVETNATNAGILDALEMVLRTPPAPRESSASGNLLFRISQEDGYAELALKPEITFSEQEYRQEAAAAKLLALAPRDIFSIRDEKRCTVSEGPASELPLLADDFRLTVEDSAAYEVRLEQLLRYHGGNSLCGLCLTWSLVRQLCAETGRGAVLPRRKCEFEIGARGDGIRDGAEFLFRGFGDGRVFFGDKTGEGLRAPVAPSGSGVFAFRITLPGEPSRRFVLKDAFVPHEYFRLCEKKNASPGSFAEEAERKRLQIEFARCMLREQSPFAVS